MWQKSKYNEEAPTYMLILFAFQENDQKRPERRDGACQYLPRRVCEGQIQKKCIIHFRRSFGWAWDYIKNVHYCTLTWNTDSHSTGQIVLRKYMNIFSTAHHSSLFSEEGFQSLATKPIYFRSIIVLPSIQVVVSSFQVIRSKRCMHFGFLHKFYMSNPSYHLCFHRANISWGVQIVKALITKLFPASCHFVL
jgi:hypothetical protein